MLPLVRASLAVAALGLVGCVGTSSGLGHVAVANDSEDSYYIRLVWPDMTVVYPIDPGGRVIAVNTIGITGYHGPIELLSPECELLESASGLGPTHSLVHIGVDGHPSITATSVAVTRDFTPVDGKAGVCGATWPPN